jgi:hypothetical protein
MILGVDVIDPTRSVADREKSIRIFLCHFLLHHCAWVGISLKSEVRCESATNLKSSSSLRAYLPVFHDLRIIITHFCVVNLKICVANYLNRVHAARHSWLHLLEIDGHIFDIKRSPLMVCNLGVKLLGYFNMLTFLIARRLKAGGSVSDVRGGMKGMRVGRTRFLTAACVIAAVATGPGAYAFEPKWPAGSYSYLVIDQDIKDVLVEFGHNVGLPTHVGEEIKMQRVTGPLPDASAQAFLKDVCTAYGVVWYYDGATLSFNAASEVKGEMVNLGRLLRSDMVIRQLEKAGVADARYPLRATADTHVISISGPPSYRKLVRQEIIAMAKALESGVLVVRAGRGG